MPTIAEQRASALLELQRKAQASRFPALADEDVTALLNSVQRADIWEASTEYVFGDMVIPTTRNGHVYKCIEAGESAADEPTWPKTDFKTITDGTSDPILRWQEAGADFDNVFDVRQAIHEAWMLKADRVAGLYDIEEIGSKHNQSQVYDHCIEQAEKYAPLLIG